MPTQKTRPGSSDAGGPLARIGTAPAPRSTHSTWVQTERASHDAWADLVRSNARAAALLHKLVANMDRTGAVVASRGTLAKLLGCSEATIKRAAADLRAERWIEVVQLGGKGGVNAYVVNSRVAWADSRDRLPGAAFTARVLAARDEQERIETTPLRRIPTLYPGEQQLPSGPGEDPPSQPEIAGLEIDLPAIDASRERVDPETGEVQWLLDLDQPPGDQDEVARADLEARGQLRIDV